MKIIFTHLKPDIWQYKVASTLKDKHVKTVSISLLDFDRKMFNKAFDEIICLGLPNLKPHSVLLRLIKNPVSFFRFFYKINKTEANAVICQGAPFWLTSYFLWLFKGKFPRIFFPYDWNASMYYEPQKYIPRREIFGEEYSCKNCDAIIHKNAIEELDLLPKKFIAKNKPILHFSCYPFTKWFVSYFSQKKLSYKDKKVHIVYVGFFCDSKHQSMVSHINQILKQKIHIHIYPNDKLNDKLISKITQNKTYLEKYFHIEDYISPNKLSKEISKYDFGVHYSEFSDIALPDIEKVGFGNKRSSYFEALIPIIIQKQMEFVSEDVKKNYLGILIKDIKNLDQEIRKLDYKKSIKNIQKFRKNTSVKSNINRLIKFINILNEK